jgi:flagellar protein FlbT
MKAKMKFSLKAGERIFINGAVLTVSGKTTLSLLNDAQFLLESHVLQVSQATTPMRQLYFMVQALLINPAEAGNAISVFRDLHASLLETYSDEEVKEGLVEARRLVEAGRMFEALKVVRNMFEVDGDGRPAFPAVSVAQQAA